MLKSITIRIEFDPSKVDPEDMPDSFDPDRPAGEQADLIMEAMNEARGITAHLLTYEGDD